MPPLLFSPRARVRNRIFFFFLTKPAHAAHAIQMVDDQPLINPLVDMRATTLLIFFHLQCSFITQSHFLLLTEETILRLFLVVHEHLDKSKRTPSNDVMSSLPIER